MVRPDARYLATPFSYSREVGSTTISWALAWRPHVNVAHASQSQLLVHGGIGALTSRMDHQLFDLRIVVMNSITDFGEAHRYAAALSGLDGLRLGSDHITVEEHHPSAQTSRAVS